MSPVSLVIHTRVTVRSQKCFLDKHFGSIGVFVGFGKILSWVQKVNPEDPINNFLGIRD